MAAGAPAAPWRPPHAECSSMPDACRRFCSWVSWSMAPERWRCSFWISSCEGRAVRQGGGMHQGDAGRLLRETDPPAAREDNSTEDATARAPAACAGIVLRVRRISPAAWARVTHVARLPAA